MKLLIVNALFLLIAFSSHAQQTIPPKQLPDDYLTRFSSQPKGVDRDGIRQLELQQLMANYSFSSYQVKKICEGFVTDEARLMFAMAVYPRVFDKDNFYKVYDAFAWFSSVFRLHDFVNQNEIAISQPIIFPDCHDYHGLSNCPVALPSSDFEILLSQAKELNGDQAKYPYLVSVVRNNCLTVSYVMKFALLLTAESLRLDLIRQAYPALYDLNNLGMISQLFTDPTVLVQFRKFEDDMKPSHGFDPLPPEPAKPVCQVPDVEFLSMVQSLENQSFNNTKLTLAKQILSGVRCFSVKQIIALVNTFSFEESRLEIAKHAYAFCYEKDKYYQLVDVFDFEASKNDLMIFLENK